MEILSNSLGAQINIVARALRTALEKELTADDATPSHWMLLMALGEKDHQSQTGLGRLIHLDNATITRIVDKLEEKGLLKRKQDKSDRRTQIVSLTEQGWKVYRRWIKLGEKVNAKAAEGLKTKEISQLMRWLEILQENLDYMNSNG